MANEPTPSSQEKEPWSDGVKSQYANKQFSEFFDPCQEAADRSLRCLHRNGGDKSMCSDYFQLYRDCKKQWITRRNEARKAAPQ